jgi:cytochrome c-type biogenesis protein CcmF
LTSNVQEIGRPVVVRVRAHGERPLKALGRVIRANRHRYGGYIAHVGLIVTVVGIAASSSYRNVQEATIRTGETMQVEQYEIRLLQLWSAAEPHRMAVGADLALSREGKPLGRMEPRINYYRTEANPIPTAAVRTRLVDVYVTLMAYEPDGSSATFRAAVEPLVGSIWVGSVILAIGALVAAWPERRRPTRATARQPSGKAVRRRQPRIPAGAGR